jgi:MFS family permease
MVRMFAYGFLSVVLALYLSEIGLSEFLIGLLLSLTLLGDTAISLWMTTNADRVGGKRMLVAGSGLMFLAGGVFACTDHVALLLPAAIVGVISPSGYEVGPFLAIEQAALSETLGNERLTGAFAWYNLLGSFSTAFGALVSGAIPHLLQVRGFLEVDSYRAVILGYASMGLLLAGLFSQLSSAVEAKAAQRLPLHARFGLHRSRRVIFKLSALFGLDAFAGGFVVQSMVAYWFHAKFGVDAGSLGKIFFAANLVAGVSSLAAAWVAKRIGLINTMVFTHLPSNVLLMLVPLMPSVHWAIALLLLRFSISQMDVPPRQAYTVAVVGSDERSAAAGVTGIARTIGSAVSPALSGYFLGLPMLMGLPFLVAGGLKIVYDLLLYHNFRKAFPANEAGEAPRGN